MVIKTLEELGILPIINTNNPKVAKPLVNAMKSAGMNICEVVFRSPEAPDVLKALKDAWPEMIIGAGTIVREEQVDLAIACGAEFLISPGFDFELVRYMQSKSIMPVPGATSASEVQLASKLGLEILKFFPAKQMGGLSTIDALSAPFPHIRYIPTNGVNLSNVEEYIANPHVLACGGTFPTMPDMISAGDWDGIREACEKALFLAKKGMKKRNQL